MAVSYPGTRRNPDGFSTVPCVSDNGWWDGVEGGRGGSLSAGGDTQSVRAEL